MTTKTKQANTKQNPYMFLFHGIYQIAPKGSPTIDSMTPAIPYDNNKTTQNKARQNPGDISWDILYISLRG